jgi:spore coat polysaccharide biosynthesis predicted glycosyltransferase SpsG
MFEFLYLGIPPAIINRFADDDMKYASELEQKGLAVSLGYYNSLDFATFKKRIEDISYHDGFIKSVSFNGSELIDGEGAKRVAEAILRLS